MATISCPGGSPIASLAPGSTETCGASYTLTQADVDAGQKLNTATAAGQDGGGAPVQDVDSVALALPAGAVLVALKSGILGVDADGSGALTPGDTLQYTVVIESRGAAGALAVRFDDQPDPNTALVPGTVSTSRGAVLSGNGAGDTRVTVDVGDLPPGDTVLIGFEVQIAAPLPSGVVAVANQGSVSAANHPDLLTDDPDTGNAGDATVHRIVLPPAEIPLLPSSGLALLALLLALLALRLLPVDRP